MVALSSSVSFKSRKQHQIKQAEIAAKCFGQEKPPSHARDSQSHSRKVTGWTSAMFGNKFVVTYACYIWVDPTFTKLHRMPILLMHH